jgi:hypothetical protein
MVFGVYTVDFQILNRNSAGPHVAGHSSPFEDPRRIR